MCVNFLGSQSKTKQNKNNKQTKTTRKEEKDLSAFRVEALPPTVEAYLHAVSSSAPNRCCHFCCHNFVWSLMPFFSLCLVFGQIFHFQCKIQRWSMWRQILHVDSHRAVINWAFANPTNDIASQCTKYLSLAFIPEPVCILHICLCLHYQSSFCTSVFSILHITPVSDSSGYPAKSVWSKKRICKDIIYSLHCKVN